MKLTHDHEHSHERRHPHAYGHFIQPKHSHEHTHSGIRPVHFGVGTHHRNHRHTDQQERDLT